MSSSKHNRPARALRTFRARKVCTIDELAALLACSAPTARRRLKQWNAHTSYNKNGRYYALPDVVRFDADGLWRYRGICFSQYGNLHRTLVGLVKHSPAGLCATELRALLGVEPRSFLSLFRNHPDLRRKKFQGRFVYFAAERQMYHEQRRRREEMGRKSQMPSEAEAVAMLVEAIKHPDLSAEQLAARLRKRSFHISAQAARNLFAAHGLTGKKTHPSQP
jgi:hypothetical protein